MLLRKKGKSGKDSKEEEEEKLPLIGFLEYVSRPIPGMNPGVTLEIN